MYRDAKANWLIRRGWNFASAAIGATLALIACIMAGISTGPIYFFVAGLWFATLICVLSVVWRLLKHHEWQIDQLSKSNERESAG